MYPDERDLESKAGQYIYDYIMTERLREYLLERFKNKGNMKFEIPLGEDKEGNTVIMSVNITKINPEAKRLGSIPEGEPDPITRNHGRNLAADKSTDDAPKEDAT
ncbi:MAG: hypothetical protein ACE5KG_05735 [Nitrososphaerales archaeon]